jgi:hypothetical protein
VPMVSPNGHATSEPVAEAAVTPATTLSTLNGKAPAPRGKAKAATAPVRKAHAKLKDKVSKGRPGKRKK